MIRDAELIMSGTMVAGVETGQRISASGATASTDYIDTLAAGDAMKPGARIHIVATEILAGTGTTVTIALQTDGDVAFGSPVTLLVTAAIAKAATAAGTVLLDSTIPYGVERYLRVVYTTDNTMETTGRISAYIVLDSERTLDRQL